MKIKRLDRRMKGYGDFEYKIEYRKKIDRRDFVEQRNWCWEQWGPSCELENWDLATNPAWCWFNDEWGMKILLASEREATWYTLKWK